MPEFEYISGSEYAKCSEHTGFLNMLGLHKVLNMPEQFLDMPDV